MNELVNELALFAGAGGGLLATKHLLGWRCVGYVEKEDYPCRVLEARIKDGLLSPAPIFQMHTRDFIRLGLAEKYRGVADVITAGFPCQPFSQAGKRLGEADERNAWPDTIAIIRLLRPSYVLLENVSRLITNRYFDVILGNLATSGYDCRWDCLPASAVGANHQRDRVWIVAYDTCQRKRDVAMEWQQNEKDIDAIGLGQEIPNSDNKGQPPHIKSKPGKRVRTHIKPSCWWQFEPDVVRVVNGVAFRVDRLKAIGNGQVPAVVKEVWRLLK